MTGTIWHLALATALFVGSHMALSDRRVRGPLVSRVGERPFQGLYSLLALVLLMWIAGAYNDAPVVDVWIPGSGFRHLSLAIMPFACILLVAGVTTPNPTAAGADTRRLAESGPVGILKVTRHPVMWSFALWGVAHLLANGEAADMLLFGGMTLLALAGALAIDGKKRAAFGAAWKAYETATSFLPFAAILRGRARVSLGEIGWWRLLAGLALYAVLLFAHEWIFAVSPLPG